MSILARVKRGDAELPPRILIAGPEGIGKSTIASQAPSPLFICSEDGLTGLEHVARFSPSSLQELNALLDELVTNPGEYKSLVIDTADWLERMIYDGICKRDGKANIEDYGYGKGYTIAEQELVSVLAKLDQIRHAQRLWIVVLSHVQIRTFQDPRGDSWDRYEMKGNKKFTGIFREWPDACLFAVFEVFKTKEKGSIKEKTIGGDRVLHTQWSPAWDAKNRLNLPESIPLNWESLAGEIEVNSPTALRKRIAALYATAKLTDAAKAQWEKTMPLIGTLPPDRLKAAVQKLETLQ
jgi:hypothetical protein